MKTLFIFEVLVVSAIIYGCATGKIQDSTIKIADTVKIAEEIKIAETIKIADEIKPEVKLVAVDKSENIKTETKQSAGRDLSITTDPALIKSIFEAEKKLMEYIVKGLIGLCSSLILILGWCLKTLITQGKQKKTLEIEKKDYKDNFLARCIKDEKDLAEWRGHHKGVKLEKC